MQNTVRDVPGSYPLKYLPEIVSAHQLHYLLYTGSIQLIKISSNNNKGTVLPVRFKKSNCASFKATRYVLFCPCEPSFFYREFPNSIFNSSL